MLENKAFSLPKVKITNGTIEALKYFALLLMAGDHINRYILESGIPFLFNAGRLAMPIFVFVLAYNLARSEEKNHLYYKRIMSRLLFFAVISIVPFYLLSSLSFGWWPLNILFTLLLITAIISLIERKMIFLSIILFVIGGGLVEYWWPAVALGVASWLYIKKPRLIYIAVIVASLLSLVYINGNHWALLSIPVIITSTFLRFNVDRGRLFFYYFYPSHLMLIYLFILFINIY